LVILTVTHGNKSSCWIFKKNNRTLLMFYEVRVLDRKGNVKKVLSSKELSRHYWNDFENHLHGQTPPQIKGKGRKGLRKQKMGGLRGETENHAGSRA
jgi:hypothetical protein